MANKQPIFITGRFRSGTSFLWQLFNQLDGFCAWYEPLHPQLLEAIKHVAPKDDHVGVLDYWQTYRDKPDFSNYYSNQFATEQLYLEDQQQHPSLKTYINHLLKLSAPAMPVLQFNRVDLRLPWLKSQFPDAMIIHIERNPLQLYESQRKHIDQRFRHQADYWDAYELAQWSYALYEQFPCLTEKPFTGHAFYRFYLLYQLSKMMAKAYADISINLDVDVFQGEDFIEKLAQHVDLSHQQRQFILKRVHVPELSEFDESKSNNLIEIMTEVDLLLAKSGLLEGFGQKSMAAIRLAHKDFWQPYKDQDKVVEQLNQVAQTMIQELNRIDVENKQLTNELLTLNANVLDLMDEFEPVTSLTVPSGKANVNDLLTAMNELSGQMTLILARNQQLRSARQAEENTVDE